MEKSSRTFLFFALLTVIFCSALLPVFSLQNNVSISSYGTINYSGLQPTPSPSPTPTPTPTPTPPPASPTGKYVGFRSNGEETWQYWLSVAERYTSYVAGSTAVGQWIFPEAAAVTFSQTVDDALTFFDSNGVYVFLQPGEDVQGIADPYVYDEDYLLERTLANYGSHSCVLGAGLDLEFRGANWWEYVYTTDAEATRWVNIVKSYNPNFKLFLKHWSQSVMPPTVRDGIVFVDDGNGFTGLSDMVSVFEAWGRSFSSADVGFGVGYSHTGTNSDWNRWIQYLDNPPKTIAEAIFNNVPNAKWVYWVNVFKMHEAFP